MQTEAIKRAQKNMTKNGRQVVHFLVRFSKEEAEEIDRVIKDHKIQKTDFIRRTIKALEGGRL